MPSAPARENLTRFAWLSVVAAVATIALKFGAYLLTGSVGLLSDAAESVVNLVAAFVALIALHVAAQPADADHQFGHTKAEYFSAAVEGVMIFVAAIFILWSSVQRFLAPEPLENVGMGLGISVAASVLNGAVAFVLMRAGRQHNSITLVADGKHLMTDVWTSAGVVLGVLLVVLTGWLRLDPIIAFLVGCNIIWTGWHLVRDSVDGLMDHAPSPECQADIQKILNDFTTRESSTIAIHGVRARVAGHVNHVAFHVLVPGAWTVREGHDLLEEIEGRFHDHFGHIVVDTHLEPIEDPRSHDAPQWESTTPVVDQPVLD
ncbi:MAG: cation transporter [Actinomycetales bacterium]|jgi:cation diffusion facilitator family transporter|nr:cation transporter [Candidatus Phosphoribacter baldrii]